MVLDTFPGEVSLDVGNDFSQRLAIEVGLLSKELQSLFISCWGHVIAALATFGSRIAGFKHHKSLQR